MKVLALRRADTCATCATALPVGARAAWSASGRTVHCLSCLGTTTSSVPEPAPATPPAATWSVPVAVPLRAGGEAGASAQHEHDRRVQGREQRVRQAHPRLGGLLLAMTSEPVSTRVWAQGAAGERAVAASLDELVVHGLVVLHDRALRRPDGRLSRADVDHLVVAASGVWVVDAKTHRGALEVRRSGGLLGPRREHLVIGGRDQTRLVDGLLTQVAAVARELQVLGLVVPVRGALCFVGTELPWFGSTSVAGVPLVGRRHLAALLRADGGLLFRDRQAVGRHLAERFPAARSST